MAEKNVSSVKVPEFLREPLEAAQTRLVEFEEEAQKVFKDLMQKGKESRKDFAELVQRLSKQDWNMDELRGRVTKLRVQSMTRAEVEELSRELERLARRLDKSEKVRKARKAGAKRPAAEV